MKDKDYNRLFEFVNMWAALLPYNQNAIELIEQSVKGEVLTFRECTQRDLKFHRCYMLLISTIYNYLPKKFKSVISKDKFYQFLKHLKGDYEVLFKFQDGTQLVEYESIAFGNMSQKRFEAYVREQLPFIYENLIRQLFDEVTASNIIDTIEEQFEKFLSKL